MKVLHFSWSDSQGGAARAAWRLHRALSSIGVSSKMLVAVKGSQDRDVLGPESIISRVAVRGAARLDQLFLHKYKSRNPVLFSPALAATRTVRSAGSLPRDICHLHWITNGFLRVEDLRRLGRPLVWTLHDVWGFTGGCHYPGDCSRFKDSCGCCPILDSQSENDLSRKTGKRKHTAWRDLNFTLIAPSRWMAKMAASSSLFRNQRIEVIPNGLDAEVYRPCDRAVARSAFSLPRRGHVLLFGALTGGGDLRKGVHLLKPVLERFARNVNPESVCLAVMGSTESIGGVSYPFPVHYLGILNKEADVALAYTAADVFLAPSIEENLPNTVMEALSCGTPCVAFDVGGMSDMIEHQKNGYLAKPFDTDEFSQGLFWLLEDENRRRSLGEHARNKVVSEFGTECIAGRHLKLYEELLSASKVCARVETC